MRWITTKREALQAPSLIEEPVDQISARLSPFRQRDSETDLISHGYDLERDGT